MKIFIPGNRCNGVTETFAEIDGLPNFSCIDPDEIEEAIKKLLAFNREEVAGIVGRAGDDPTWDSLVAPLEEIDDRLTKAWVPISHLNAVVNTDALRAAHDGCLVALTSIRLNLDSRSPFTMRTRTCSRAKRTTTNCPRHRKKFWITH